jgi:hypothetical protein
MRSAHGLASPGDAEALPENYQMQHVLAAAGLPMERRFLAGEVDICLSLAGVSRELKGR